MADLSVPHPLDDAGPAPSLPARAAVRVVRAYQLTVSPALAALNPSCGCRFTPSCSHYAQDALRVHGLLAGTALTLRRLAKCGPWHPGGEDPVPPAASPLRSVSPNAARAS